MQRHQNSFSYASLPALLALSSSSTRRVLLLSFFFILLGAIISLCWIDNAVTMNISNTTTQNLITAASPETPQSLQPPSVPLRPPPPPPTVITFACPTRNQTSTSMCPSHPPTFLKTNDDPSPSPSCPDYFRWIHEDLRPWKPKGITRVMVERARRTANFRLVIIHGRAYVESYQKSFQSRDVFTLWGILQLLRRYPGQVPDLDLMFDCVDWPLIRKDYFKSAPPPLFRYCGNDSTLDIVFPDWSFWGWPEINIKPWDLLLNELKEGNKRMRWMDREPYAYWKGNPAVAATRQDLLKCNVSEGRDWNARLYAQAQAIGKEGSSFIQEKLSMDYVYDYMLHLLSEYAKLLTYEPTVPAEAVELCAESMVCPAKGLERKFMMESMVLAPHTSKPCSLPPPYSPVELGVMERRKANSMKQVVMWERD